jgi:hypothetical protein
VANTSSHPITVEGVRLDTFAWNIEVKTGWDLGQGARGGNNEVPGMDGELWTPNKREGIGRMALQMWVMGSDASGNIAADKYELYRQNLDQLRWLFGKRNKLLTIQHTLGATIGTRECLAEVVDSFDPTVTAQGLIGRFSVLCKIPGTYWRDTADQNYDLTSATVGQKTLTPFLGATANMRDLQIVFDGPWTGPSITDDATGHILVGPTITTGNQWMVDTVAHTSKTGSGIAFTSGGTQAMLTTSRTGAFAPGLFGITPAGPGVSPTVTLGGSGTGAGSRIRIRGRRKFR